MPVASWHCPTSGKTLPYGNSAAPKAKSMSIHIVMRPLTGCWSARAPSSVLWQAVILKMVTWYSMILPAATLKGLTPRAISSPRATHAVAQKIKGTEGLHTISALTHRQIVELLERKVISPELFDEKRIVEVLDPEDTKRRYCLCRNPQTARHEATTRQRLLDRARAQLEKIAGSRRRATEKRLGARVGRVLERTKMGKFIQWQVVEGKLLWSFDQDKIAAERLFDGCYIVSCDVPQEQMAT